MAEYTPGPWVRDPHECGGVYSANSKRVFGGGYAGEVWWDGEADADYALVLAGPDMYEALKKARATIEAGLETEGTDNEHPWSVEDRQLIAEIDAALRKAEGAE